MKTHEIIQSKTVTNPFKSIINKLMRVHEKTSSYTAQLIGPIVFKYKSNQNKWNLSTKELLSFPKGTVGKTLGEFLYKNRLEPLAKAEYHDVDHILFDFDITFKGEVALQYFLFGNGVKTIASITTFIGGWLVLPFHWNYLLASYKRGKTCKNITTLNVETLLTENFNQIKSQLFQSTI